MIAHVSQSTGTASEGTKFCSGRGKPYVIVAPELLPRTLMRFAIGYCTAELYLSKIMY